MDLPVSPHLLVGFRREGGSWVQVPVQVLSSLIGQLLLAREKMLKIPDCRLMRGMKWTGTQ